MTGWIKLHRKLLGWEWYKNPNTFRLFMHCLLKANIKDTTWKGQAVKRGQFITSVGALANELGLSSQQIRTAFANMQTSKQITIKPTNKWTLVTLINYDDYQEKQKQTNKQTKPKVTSHPTTVKEERRKEVRIIIGESLNPKFENIFLDWLEYKAEIKDYPKSNKSINLAYSKLVRLSNNNPSIAKAVINQSIESNWKGLFALKGYTPTEPEVKQESSNKGTINDYFNSKIHD